MSKCLKVKNKANKTDEKCVFSPFLLAHVSWRLKVKATFRTEQSRLQGMHWPLAWIKAPPALFPIPASMPFTSWQIDGENVETGSDFLVLGSKITGDGDCSHKSKRCLLLGRKAMTKLDSVLKSRDITLPTKVCIVKAMLSPVVMYGCWGLDYKKRLSLEKTFESPLDCKEIKPINPTGNQY